MSADVVIHPGLLDSSKTCRLCLQQSVDLCPLFPETEPTDSTVTSLPSKIMACVSIEVLAENTMMPKQICSKCVQQIDSWIKFKELCLSANAFLQQCLANVQSSTNYESETLKFNLQGPEQTPLYDMDVSIFERDSLFGQFEEGSLQLSEDLNVSFSESIFNQKIQSSKKRDTSILQSKKIDNNKLDSYANILSSEVESVNTNNEDKGKKSDKTSIWKTKYDEVYRKEYPCNICKKTFSKFMHLLRHDKLEHADQLKDLNCSICGQLFVSQSRLDIHILKHREKTFECSECHKMMISKKSLSVHMRRHSANNKYTCNICNSVKNSQRMLDDHIRSVHIIEFPFRCELCGKKFKTSQSKDLHHSRHLNQKIYKCTICGCLLPNKNSFKSHIQTHKGEKDLICHICGKCFKTNILLNNHVDRHLDKKPYKCLVCSCSFPRRYLLARHEATHFDLQPFKCTFCDKSFKRKDTLAVHIKNHTGEKPYSCGSCLRTFFSGRSLKRHRCSNENSANNHTDCDENRNEKEIIKNLSSENN